MVQFRVTPTGGSLDALAQRLIAAGYDVYGGGNGGLLVHAAGSQRDRLTARTDLRVESEQAVTAASTAAAPGNQDVVLPDLLDGNEYETFYGGYRTHDAYTQFLSDLEAAYPDLVHVVDYGTSFTGRTRCRSPASPPMPTPAAS